MSAELADMMFEILKKRQGEMVFCTVWAKGKEFEKQGILTEVVEYERVTVDDLDIPFDNGVIAISEIKLMNGKVVFANPGVVPMELRNSNVQESEVTATPVAKESETTVSNSAQTVDTPVSEVTATPVVEGPEANLVSEQPTETTISNSAQAVNTPVSEVKPAVKIVDFDALESRIGTHVRAKSWRYGVEVPYEGVLTEVVPNDRMTLNNNIIPFVGESEAVEEIQDLNGNVIYSVPEAKGYTPKDQMGLVTAQLEMLGYSVKMAEMEGKGKAR